MLGRWKGLYLFSNQLTGVIPMELGGLESLKQLYLFSDQLTGEPPTELNGLESLAALNLNNNAQHTLDKSTWCTIPMMS